MPSRYQSSMPPTLAPLPPARLARSARSSAAKAARHVLHTVRAAPSSSSKAWPATQLTLWYSAQRKDYQTCGSAHCLADTAAGYTLVGDLCFAFNGTGAANQPCLYGGNSIVRSDDAFLDNDYWRGRIWGPHLQLIYWALSNAKYRDMPSVVEVRTALVAQGRRLVLQEWNLFRQITENYNGLVGAGEDVGNADPFYIE